MFAPSAGKHYPRAIADVPNRPRDANELAKFIVDMAAEAEVDAAPKKAADQQKGGVKGSVARAFVLSPEQRSEIAVLAAQVRRKKI